MTSKHPKHPKQPTQRQQNNDNKKFSHKKNPYAAEEAQLLRAKMIQIALQHTALTKEETASLSILPSVFCPCKRCYDDCEYRLTHINCPPAARQHYYLDRIIAFIQFDRAKSHMLTLEPLKAITFASAFLWLSEELFRLLATSKISMLLSSTLIRALPDDAFDHAPIYSVLEISARVKAHQAELKKRAATLPKRAQKLARLTTYSMPKR